MLKKLTVTDTICYSICVRFLYWISGKSERRIVRGSWLRDVPNVMISVDSLEDPVFLKYDVESNR